MSVTPSSTIVGVFRDQSMADQAVNALYDAGFGQEEIQYLVPGTSGSFFEGLRNFFSGTSDSGGNLANDLTNMGLSDEEAQYYANEYNNGSALLVVRAAERDTEAMNVLRQYGAYNTRTEPAYFGGTAADTQQPGDYTQQGSYGTSEQSNDVQSWETSPQAQTSEEHPYAGVQPDNVASQYDQVTTPVAPATDTEAQDMQAGAVASEYDAGNQVTPTDTDLSEQEDQTPTDSLAAVTPHDDEEYHTAQAPEVAPEHESSDQSVEAVSGEYETEAEPQDADASVSVLETETTEAEPQDAYASVTVLETETTDQAVQADSTPSEQEYSSQTIAAETNGYDSQSQVAQTVPVTSDQETEKQPAQANMASPGQTDELQQLQAQLQTLQQQLQEAKDRLQAARDQEDHIKTAREREQQLQSTRQQLQDTQADLQATLAELEEVQSRIAQYQ